MVPFVHLHSVISLIIKLFELSGYEEFEDYAADVLNKYSEDFVSIWVLANLETNKAITLKEPTKENNFDDEKELLKEEFADLDFWSHVGENFYESISYLGKKLWTIEGEDPRYKPKIQRTNFR